MWETLLVLATGATLAWTAGRDAAGDAHDAGAGHEERQWASVERQLRREMSWWDGRLLHRWPPDLASSYVVDMETRRRDGDSGER